MNWKLLASALLFTTLTACGTDGTTTDDRVHVRGSVGQELRTPGLRAVAIAGDGRWFSTAIDTKGGFDLALPAGASYRVVITQGQTIVARVVLEGGQGKTVWVQGREAGTTVSFGVLRQAGSIATQTVGESESESDDEGAEAGDDHEDESSETSEDDEHGDDGDYSACSSTDEKELEPSNPGAAQKCEYGEEEDEKEHACGS